MKWGAEEDADLIHFTQSYSFNWRLITILMHSQRQSPDLYDRDEWEYYERYKLLTTSSTFLQQQKAVPKYECDASKLSRFHSLFDWIKKSSRQKGIDKSGGSNKVSKLRV